MNEQTSVFIGVMGPPYESEMVTTLFRMLEEMNRQGHQVTVWTCGSATSLTLKSLGDLKPRNLSALGVEYPSVSKMVKELIANSSQNLDWLVCRHCMDERGTQEQIEEVKIKPTFKYMDYYRKASIRIILGKK